MRRQDKKKNMKKVNILFEQRCINENAFSWDGNYANEEITEDCGLTLGNDLECECEKEDKEPITEFETTDVEASEFFSDEEAAMVKDGPTVG